MSKFNVNTGAERDMAPIPVKQWTNLDHLTHDFMDSPDYRLHCLQKYGQYMGANGKRVTAGD